MQALASVYDPHSIPSHGTIENHHLRRYLLEDIMSASPGERLLILVSSSHPYWGEYIKVINRCPPLPRVIQGLLSFWQIHINCVKNAQLKNDYNKESILALLYGNQRGGIGIEYVCSKIQDIFRYGVLLQQLVILENYLKDYLV